MHTMLTKWKHKIHLWGRGQLFSNVFKNMCCIFSGLSFEANNLPLISKYHDSTKFCWDSTCWLDDNNFMLFVQQTHLHRFALLFCLVFPSRRLLKPHPYEGPHKDWYKHIYFLISSLFSVSSVLLFRTVENSWKIHMWLQLEGKLEEAQTPL